jgi:hypothetical protein
MLTRTDQNAAHDAAGVKRAHDAAGVKPAYDAVGAKHAARAFGRAALCACVVLAVAGCSGRSALRSTFGVTLEQPDPFNVLPRKPLRIPPNFEDLPPPRPGEASPLDPTPVAAAEATLNRVPDGAGAPSIGELALLGAAGAGGADPGIRSALAEDAGPKESSYGLTTFFGLRVPDGSGGEILDQRAEADRINAAGGDAPNPPPALGELKSNEVQLGLF